MERCSTRKRKADEENRVANNENDSDINQTKLRKKATKLEENQSYEKENDLSRRELKVINKEEELIEKDEQLDKRCADLTEKEEEFDKKSGEMKVKEKEFEKLKKEMKVKEEEFNKLKKLAQEVTDKVECPVCKEPPLSSPVNVCKNGHIVCKKCKRDKCPTCRVRMYGELKSLLALTILEKIDHRCRFVGCEDNLSFKDIEKHEATCHQRTVLCPYQKCPEKEVSLLNLVDHLLKSEKCCLQINRPKTAVETWNTLVFSHNSKYDWPLNIFSFSGEIFGVFPDQDVMGQYYFVFVMFNSEEESSEYRFEAVVHESEKSVEHSEVKARFEGSPVSIEIIKKELTLNCASELKMQKIMDKSDNKNSFSLSFKLFKK